MTTDTKREVANAVCVTGWSVLAGALRQRLGHVQVEDHLADIVVQNRRRVMIIDTKVSDLDIWPAPLLMDPRAGQHLWLFLLSDARDAAPLVPLPPNAAFFARSVGALDGVIDFVCSRSDPSAQRRIHSVRFLAEAGVFIVKMESGQSYVLPLEDVSAADMSKVKRVAPSRDRSYFRAVQESGQVLEVPWDVVLRYCEPSYEYYKNKDGNGSDKERALAIGDRVKELRLARGLSVARLADLAGMHRPNLSRLEAGRHFPSLETLERVADALEVPVATIVARRVA